MTFKKLLVAPLTLAFVALVGFGPLSASAAGPVLLVGLNPLTVTQTGPAAAPNTVFANIRFDAGLSTEDILVSRIPLTLNVGGGAFASNLLNCRVVNQNTTFPLNSNGNVMNGVSSTNLNTFVLDNPLRVTAGTATIVSVMCDIAASNAIGNTYQFTINPASVVATSAVSGAFVTPGIGNGVIVGNGTSVTTSGSTGTVFPIVTPGLPNTGAGGDATLNIALLIGALVVAGASIAYTRNVAR
jgi:hypothetical protein